MHSYFATEWTNQAKLQHITVKTNGMKIHADHCPKTKNMGGENRKRKRKKSVFSQLPVECDQLPARSKVEFTFKCRQGLAIDLKGLGPVA